MRNKNAVSLIGIVGKDTEVKLTQQGTSYARFSLATSTGGYKKQDGTDVPEVTQWHNITCWKNLADMAGKFIKKGMKVDVEGMIIYGSYTDNNGVQRNSVEIVANDIVLMSQPHTQQQAPQQNNQNVQQAGGYQQNIGYQQQGASQQAGGYQQQQGGNQNGYQQQQNGGGQPFPPPASDDLPF